MELRPTEIVRRECRDCGSHTYSDHCGTCGGGVLTAVVLHPSDLREEMSRAAIRVRPDRGLWLLGRSGS